ncbi:MAG: hypothetical protein ACK41O_26765, partial [Runella zeae]
ELQTANSALDAVLNNWNRVIRREYFLSCVSLPFMSAVFFSSFHRSHSNCHRSVHTIFFGYAGAISTYIIVGIAVFWTGTFKESSSDSPGSIAERISQSSFMCMQLLFGFSVLVQLA